LTTTQFKSRKIDSLFGQTRTKPSSTSSQLKGNNHGWYWTQQTLRSPHSLSSDEKKKLRDCIYALNDSMTRAAAERDLQKEAINEIFDELGIDKKIVRRMAQDILHRNYNTMVEEQQNFQNFYDNVIKDS
jgi:DNA-directed RNA polymerase subunit N (RpoN/RPB10)